MRCLLSVCRRIYELTSTIRNSWIVASNTSYLKLIEEDDELIQGVPKAYRQFRLVVGSPAKEHVLQQNVLEAQRKCVAYGFTPGS